MNVMIVNGSPRKNGNCSYVAEKLKNDFSADNVRCININDLSMKGCQACYTCRRNNSTCIVKDDLENILSELVDIDLVVLLTPNYYGYISGQLKLFLDRWYCFKDSSKMTKFKKDAKCFFVTMQGSPNKDHGERIMTWSKRFSEGFGLTFYHYIVAGCHQDNTDMAQMKFGDIRLHLNMFI